MNPINFSRDQTDVTVNVYLCDRKVFRSEEEEEEKKSKVMKESEKNTEQKTMDMESFYNNFFRSFICSIRSRCCLAHKQNQKKKKKKQMCTIGFGSSGRLNNSKTVKMLRL